MRMLLALVAGAVVLSACDATELELALSSDKTPPPPRTAVPTKDLNPSPPTAVPTKDLNSPPAPHKEGETHGLGVTNQMVVDALVPMGFAFERRFNEVLQRPAVYGRASLGPRFTVLAAGSPRGVIEFSLETNWSAEAQPPVSAILSIVGLVTPNWEGASEWVRKQIQALSGQDNVTREIKSGNYAVRVFAFKLGDDPGIQVSISPRFASCADALAAQDWTTKGSVGNERGYAQWRVPSEPDPDGDKTVCESIP